MSIFLKVIRNLHPVSNVRQNVLKLLLFISILLCPDNVNFKQLSKISPTTVKMFKLRKTLGLAQTK